MTYTSAIIITVILLAWPVAIGFALHLTETGFWQSFGAKGE